MQRLFQPCLVIVLFIAVPIVSSSQEDDGISFTWHSANGCASRADVVGKVNDILGDESFKSTERRFYGTVQKSETTWVASLDVTANGKTFSRKVKVNTCEAATEVVALLIALAIDPMRAMQSDDEHLQSTFAVLQQSAQPSALPPPAEPPAAPVEAPPGAESEETKEKPEAKKTPVVKQALEGKKPTPMPKKDPPRSIRQYLVGLGFVADVGFAALFRPGLSLDGAFLGQRLRVEISVRYLPKFEEKVEGSDGATMESRFVAIAAAGGMHFSFGQLVISPEVGIAADGLFATSRGVANPGQGSAWFVSFSLGVPVEWWWRKWVGIRLAPSVHFLPDRPSFEIEGIGSAFQPYLVSGVFEIGVFLHF